ncbi:hypothetical protein [Natrinema salaciae]|uniref:Uncharacterized protein n=1 Tax=Natrinema salaciae TaxID=1186196 RepID=A0A1H9P3C5_9EURY|nr:hypothetical protein [Natrinema salaciae]SER42415.1 hypothetical protein SAMN04489841_3841 [Natrinema salaciae]
MNRLENEPDSVAVGSTQVGLQQVDDQCAEGEHTYEAADSFEGSSERDSGSSSDRERSDDDHRESSTDRDVNERDLSENADDSQSDSELDHDVDTRSSDLSIDESVLSSIDTAVENFLSIVTG